ncbi:MAG: hypothetical protein Q4C04_01110 [Clostridia bacterium]|nr:hypothetical protein [Clostridia bacterium]
MQNERIRQAWDKVSPDSDAKRRMRARLAGAVSDSGLRGSVRLSRHGIAALAAALVLLVSTVTLAATGVFGRINWDGSPVESQESIAPTPGPETLLPEQSVDEAIAEYLSTAPGDEIWSAIYEDGSNGTSLREAVDSLSALRELILGAEASIACPNYIPDGYEFVRASVSFHYPAGGELRLIGTEEKYGVTIEKYAVDGDYKSCVSGYSLVLKNEAGELLRVDAETWLNPEDNGFEVEGTDVYFAVEVAKMEDALIIKRGGTTVLYCYHATAYTEYPELLHELWGERLGVHSEPNMYIDAFDGVVYHISSQTLDEGELLKIAEGLE